MRDTSRRSAAWYRAAPVSCPEEEVHQQPRREIGVVPLLTDERHDLVKSMVVERLEDMQEHVAGVLSKAGLSHV